MITFPCPDQINGAALAEEIATAGFKDVSVSVIGDEVAVIVDGLVDPMPSTEEREAAMEAARQVALADCIANAKAQAEKANAETAAVIGKIVASHVPPPPVEATPEEKLAVLGLTVDDLKKLIG